MSDAAVARHKAQLIRGLKQIYRTGTITRPGAKVSNGRGGFTTAPGTPEKIWLQRETDVRLLTGHNIKPDEALVFVLNTTAEPVEGDTLAHATLGTFLVNDVSLDPVSAVYHCRCEHG